MHLLKLSEAVKDGVQAVGMVGFRFKTIGVSDAISMGTRGLCDSLQSRDLIADNIETVMGAQWYDGNISIPGCDKNELDSKGWRLDVGIMVLGLVFGISGTWSALVEIFSVKLSRKGPPEAPVRVRQDLSREYRPRYGF